MSEILNKIGFSHVIDNFLREKITPNIVSKLSLSEFEALGITNRRVIMDLRVQCSVFGSHVPVKELSICGGAPKFCIPKVVIQDLIDEGFLITEIASLLSVSERTVYRRMSDYNIRKFEFSDISDEELDSIAKTVSGEFPNCGERMINQILKNKGLPIQRERLRNSLSRVDMAGVQQRKKNRLHRRIYNVQGPSTLIQTIKLFVGIL